MKKRLILAILLSMTIFLMPLATSAASTLPSMSILIEITDENADKTWTVDDFKDAGVTFVEDEQPIFTGIDGTQFRTVDMDASNPAATMAILQYCYPVDYCEYHVFMHPLTLTPQVELGENGEIFCTNEIVVLFKEDTYVKRTSADFPFLDATLTCGRNEALGITWVILSSDNWGESATTLAAAKSLYVMDGVVFSQPSIWMYSAYGEVAQGDVNFDGSCNTTDARKLLLHVIQDESVYLKVGDLDNDGGLSTRDARMLLTSLIA